MTHIYEQIFLHCPYVRVREYLRERPAAGAIRPAAREKSVLVRYERGKDPLHFDDAWNVYWTPDGDGPCPDFAGKLTVRADERNCGAILEISGDYAPPRGAAGRAFDMAIGVKLASAAAKALLAQIGSSMEQRHRVEASAAT